MFTNWLTGTTSSSSTAQQTNATSNNNNSTNQHNEDRARHPNNLINSMTNTASSSIMSTPPDVVLEVGPAPSVRFVAHSIVLGMHSGYLRSAIRLDENALLGHGTPSADLVLYLGNVTAEQFAPLLTYMYTGYLDLNVENIFGVLLATHVLHMPRALEICRSFLARAQTEGYLNNSLPSIPSSSTCTNSNNNSNATTNNNTNHKGNAKIIRPIPSKATLPNYGFLHAAPHLTVQQHLSLNTASGGPATATATGTPNCFKTLQEQISFVATNTTPISPNLIEQQREQLRDQIKEQMRLETERERREFIREHDREREDIVVDSNTPKHDVEFDEEDEEVEVFIDSQSETENEAEYDNTLKGTMQKIRKSEEREITVTLAKDTLVPVPVESRSEPSERLQRGTIKNTPPQRSRNSTTNAQKREKRTRRQNKHNNSNNHNNHNNHNNKCATSSSGLQVAKAPIPASQLDAAEGSKVIIDVASCDGPVRFRRILNTAYGHKPDAAYTAMLPERTQQSVSLSFHQQMAKTISQQRQLQRAEESENSESSGGGGGGGSSGIGATSTNTNGGKHATKANGSNEIYVCVYCKHTFKSQYCYQKHAKRHLNPLSLNCAGVNNASSCTSGSFGGNRGPDEDACERSKSAAEAAKNDNAYARAHNVLPLPIVMSKQNATELLRREVRPLDMNVQYYPCKTCGSKFPSYYFVHKHRKMCHADEEASESGNGRGTGGGGATGGFKEAADIGESATKSEEKDANSDHDQQNI